MGVVHDTIPTFELFQPTSVDDAVSLLDRHGDEAWALAGALDSISQEIRNIPKTRKLKIIEPNFIK